MNLCLKIIFFDKIGHYQRALIDVRNKIDKLSISEPQLYGYDVRYLVMIAYTMKQNNVSPQEANEILKNTRCVVQMVHDELEKILKRSLDDILKNQERENN